jgi:hypothetical protein
MLSMTERRKKKKPNRTGVPLHAWIDPEIGAALKAYLDGTEPSVFKTAAVEQALKDFLRGKGHWPPRKSDPVN